MLLGIALALVRGYPWLTGDQGVFLSVAARVLDGDVLYAEVVDNKDPLFFYTYAAALLAGGYRAPFALDALWFALAAVSLWLLVRELRAPASAAMAAGVVYPLALAASWYRPGLSMLGALALSPLAAWLWLRGRFALAGVAVAVVLLFKLNLALVVVAPLVVFLVLRSSDGLPRRPQLVRATGGFVATGAVAATILALQGALGPYLDVIRNNVHYAGAKSPGALGGLSGHLRVVRDSFADGGRWQLPAAVLGTVVLAGVVGWTARRSGWDAARLGLAALAVLAGALATLALTAIWPHHLQMFAYPAALGVATIAAFAASRARWAGVAVGAACAAFALWSTAKLETSIRPWTDTPFTVPSTELEKARTRYFPNAGAVSYMVFGTNSENAHAVFIDDAFDLRCRWFQLYAFSRPELFDETMSCAREEAPELILVTLGFETARDPDWNAFIASARGLLERDYERVGRADPGFEVWKRKGVS